MAEDRMLSDEILLGLIKKNGGGGGTTNYNSLSNKPQIAGTELQGNKSLADLGIASAQSVSDITNGESISNFADVETALSNKQATLATGDYISISQNEISVNREIPANNYSYEIVTKSTGGNDASVTIKKYANGTLVSSTDYIYNQTGTVNVDGYFTFQWTSGWKYTLLQASTTHAEGYTASWSYLDVVDFTEVFPTEDTSGRKLVIKSEMDTALNGKQDTLTFDDTPTDGSNNPVKSNGIYDSEKDIYAVMGEMGAKNLISYPYHQNTKTEYGVTFTNNGDGSVTVSTVNTGATAEATFICHNRLNTEVNELRIKNGKYILSGCPQGGSATTYLLTTNRTHNGSSEAMGNEYGSGKAITLNGDDYGADGVNLGISIVVKSGTIITTPITFKPMLRLTSDTDNTYQPYAKTNKQLTDDVALLDSGKADTDMVAADFNSGTSYTAGNYCVQDGKLYKFKNNHSGAWSSADVDEVKITGELSALKSGLTNIGTILDGEHDNDTISVETATITALGSVTLTAGKWFVLGAIDWAANNTGYRQVAFGSGLNPARNGASTTAALTDAGKETYQQVSRVYEVVSTETVTVYGYQTSGSALNAMPYIRAIKISA